jgi:hypothetical protein
MIDHAHEALAIAAVRMLQKICLMGKDSTEQTSDGLRRQWGDPLTNCLNILSTYLEGNTGDWGGHDVLPHGWVEMVQQRKMVGQPSYDVFTGMDMILKRKDYVEISLHPHHVHTVHIRVARGAPEDVMTRAARLPAFVQLWPLEGP